MNPTDLAADADGDSVTAERLTTPVLGALADGEQPHHLLAAESLDRTRDEDTERLFPSVDASVSVAVTDRRVLFVVPKPVENETEGVAYDAIDAIEADDGPFAELQVATGATTYVANLSTDADPRRVAAYIDDQRSKARSESSEATTQPSVPDSTANAAPAEAGDDSGRDDTSGAGDTAATPLDKIEQLAELRDDGILTDEEFETRKQELLDRL